MKLNKVKYKDENWLREQYEDKRKTLKEIAKEVGVSHETIRTYLYDMGVKVRGQGTREILIDEKWLRKEYLIKKKSTYDLSREIGASRTTIYRRLCECGISRTKTQSQQTKEFRQKVSARNQNISLGEWESYVSFGPYCSKFNFRLKEYIRNLYGRRCIICGKSAFQDKRRLCIDHVDENKMQGCNNWEWRLALLCRSCHGKMSIKQNHLLLWLLLINNKKEEINLEMTQTNGAY